jgi:predicted nucleic acid-binding protein
MNIVLDGSAALAILLPDERGSKAAAAILKALGGPEMLHVPAHWWAEVANGVIVAERRGRLTQMESDAALEDARELEPETDSDSARLARDATALARLYALTVYDAAYLELAMRKKAALITLDEALGKAASKAGISVMP